MGHMHDPDCPFCAIASGRDDTVEMVFNEDGVVAFFPKAPAVLGHTLVIPAQHIPHIKGLDQETAWRLAAATQRVTTAITTALQPPGLNILQSNGAAATQTVPHLHVHVVPRYPEDALGAFWPEVSPEFSAEQRESARSSIRVAYSQQKALAQTISDPEDRRKHLDYVQSVIARMSSASSSAKSWLLPVATAAYGFALSQRMPNVALLGVAAVVIFGFLDANYLRQERAYRRLYDAVSRGLVPCFALDPSLVESPIPSTQRWWKRLFRAVARWLPPWSIWTSWSIAPFYGALVIAGVWVWFGSHPIPGTP